MKKIIPVILIIIFALGYWGYQYQQTKTFIENSMPIYNSYRTLMDDGNKLAHNMRGRNFDNLFREFGDLKQRGNDLKIKVASMSPPTSEAREIHAQLTKMAVAYDDSMSGMISLLEKGRTYQFNSFNKASNDYKESEKAYAGATEKQKELAISLEKETNSLQPLLGLPVDKIQK